LYIKIIKQENKNKGFVGLWVNGYIMEKP